MKVKLALELTEAAWLKLWDMGVKGKMWCVIKKMYEASRSAVFLEGEKSAVFSSGADLALWGCMKPHRKIRCARD